MTHRPHTAFFPLLALLGLFLTACAGPVTRMPTGSSAAIAREAQLQKELVYKNYIQDQDRIFNTAYSILTANEDYCSARTSPHIGMTAWSLHTVGEGYRQAAKNIYNLQDRLAVQSVADLGPAARAGMKSGDFLIAVNGARIPAGPAAIETASKAFKTAGYNPSNVTVERNGKAMTFRVQPVRGCDFPVLLDYNSNDINAFTDGEKIVISKGIVRFAENENELALVIAHELAHAAIDHVGKMQQNAMAGTIGGLAVDSLLAAAGINSGSQFSRLGSQLGAQQNAVAFEQEADYVGMYFMERGGYSSSRVAQFWRRMAADNPQSISVRSTHPTAPERFIAIENTHREIMTKKSRNLPLKPNMRQ